MDTDLTKLSHLLAQDSQTGVSLNDSKQKLLSQGYSQDDIALAVSSRPFNVTEAHQNALQAAPRYVSTAPDRESYLKPGRELLLEDDKQQRSKHTHEALRSITTNYNPSAGLAAINTKNFTTPSGYFGVPVAKIAVIGLVI